MPHTIDYKTFTKLTRFNTALLKQAIKNGTPLTDILSSLKTLSSVTKKEPLHNSIIMRKAFDLLPAAYLGLLAYTKPNGPDAIRVMPDGEIIDYELKTSEINSKSLWQSAGGTVYRGAVNNKDYRASLKANFGATYKLYTSGMVNSKNMRTVLMCADVAGKDGYFDAWELSGDQIVDRLQTDMWGNSKDPTTQAKTKISLNTFHNFGTPAETVIRLKGYDKWLSEILGNLPVLQPNEEFVSPN